jgi:hypothetical protein
MKAIDSKAFNPSNLQLTGLIPDIIGKLISATHDYLKTKEEQETIRAEITAQRDIALKKIETNTILLKQFIEEEYLNRRIIFDTLLKKLDETFDSNELQKLDVVLASIIEILKINPMESLIRLKIKMRENDHLIEI